MGLINWIFDIYQHGKIDDAREEARAARAEVRAVRRSGGGVDAERLEHALAELALATKTIQRMLLEKGICSGEDYRALLREVDREDGVEDGRSSL